MAKAPAKRKAPTNGALAAAKAKVAKLEAASKRQTAVKTASAAVAKAKTDLAKAKKIK